MHTLKSWNSGRNTNMNSYGVGKSYKEFLSEDHFEEEASADPRLGETDTIEKGKYQHLLTTFMHHLYTIHASCWFYSDQWRL